MPVQHDATPLATQQVARTDQIWPEPLDTPGLVPRHLKRSATGSYPFLEIFQRLLYRVQPNGDLEKVLALIGLYQALRPAYGYAKDLCRWAFTVQVSIPEHDPVAKEILTWMGSEVILKSRTRHAMLMTGNLDNINDPFNPRMMMPRPPGAGMDPIKEDVTCLPPIGTRLFWVGWRPYLFSRSGSQSSRGSMGVNMLNHDGQLQNAVIITTLGWTLKPLQAFTEICHQHKLKNLTGTTVVYFAGGNNDPYHDNWQSVAKPIRKLDTIDMDGEIKADLIRDAEYYYSEKSRQFFADCGIPYRRGYLFYGPPGTGKSSFSAALAGHLGCDIYHINLATGDITDSSLHRLFLLLPRKCIVVIEDIDSAGIGREVASSTKPKTRTKPDTPDSTDLYSANPYGPNPYGFPMVESSSRHRKRNAVTLSGLLNAIDGNASAEGRLLIMTSNNPDALDAALTRPGRIDKKVYFGNLKGAAGRSIFMRLIGRSALAHDAQYSMADIEAYAAQFASKVPPGVFTPAQVQNFLQSCRGDPIKAVNGIVAWVAENTPPVGPAPGEVLNGGSSILGTGVNGNDATTVLATNGDAVLTTTDTEVASANALSDTPLEHPAPQHPLLNGHKSAQGGIDTLLLNGTTDH